MSTIVTSSAVSALAGWGLALGVGGALLVIGLLITLDLLGANDRPWQQALRRVLRITTTPLVAVFAVSVAAKAAAILAS